MRNSIPRHSDHKMGKDDRFVTTKKGTSKPKNTLTVMFLCFAFDVPYATCKRWKLDAFASKTHVPEHKGKSMLTDKKWAAQIYSPQRMYISHGMALWVAKHPAKRNDVNAKKVCRVYKP